MSITGINYIYLTASSQSLSGYNQIIKLRKKKYEYNYEKKSVEHNNKKQSVI